MLKSMWGNVTQYYNSCEIDLKAGQQWTYYGINIITLWLCTFNESFNTIRHTNWIEWLINQLTKAAGVTSMTFLLNSFSLSISEL